MIDKFTIEECKRDSEVLMLKIRNLEYAIKESQSIINQSELKLKELIFLKRKVANSIQDLETLYLIKERRANN